MYVYVYVCVGGKREEIKERTFNTQREGQWQRGRKVEYIKEMGNIKCNYEWDSGKRERMEEERKKKKKKKKERKERKVPQLSVYSSEDERLMSDAMNECRDKSIEWQEE